nr:hypothetical protein [uncultured Flavobacterium sp.]
MKKVFSLLLISAAFVACTDDDIRTEQDFSNGPKVVGFNANFESVAYFEDIGAVNKTFPISLIGTGNGQLSESEIVIHYEVDEVNSTATEGVEFDFVDQSGVVSIPAGGSFAQFPLIVNTGQLNPTMKTELVLKLTSADGAVVGEQYNTLRIVFVGCQSAIADADGEAFTTVCTRNDGFIRNFPAPENIYLVDTNTFKTTTTATYLPGTIAPDQGYNFIDICGDITVPVQGLCQGYYSNQVYGLTTDGTDGHVDDADHVNIRYEVTFAAGNRQYVSAYTRIN